jgi:glycosidase
MNYTISKMTLAMALALNLAACGGGGDGGGGGGVVPIVDCQIEHATLACYQGNEAVAADCGLITYQVMVESFVDGDTNIGYGTGYGDSHHEGDLQGVIDSLDYIKGLGVNAIWLTPIFQSTAISGQDDWTDRLDATGYFASDYFKIDTNFGDMAKAKELVDAAHAKGLYVFFDGVFGHHKSNVAASPNGLTPQGGDNPVDYPGSLAFYKEVATYWINELKIDGWRLDQAYQVPAAQWTELREAVEAASASVTYTDAQGKTVNPLGYMVGEIWKGQNDIATQGYCSDESPALHSNFDFPMRYSVVQTFAVEESGAGGRPATTLNSGYMSHLSYPAHAMPNLMLGNHDLVRFGDLLQRGDIANPVDAEYWERHKGAFSFMAAYSGPITLYYGEEIGDELPGFADNETPCDAALGRCDDHVARTSAKVEGITGITLSSKQTELKAYVADLMVMRTANPALFNGERTHIYSDNDIYIDHKSAKDNNVLYLINISDSNVTHELTGLSIGSDGDLTDLLTGDVHKIAGGIYTLTLAPFEAQFLNIESPLADGPQSPTGDAIVGNGFMASCTNPNSSESAPLTSDMFIRGTYDGGDGFGATPTSRQFSYKGQNTYQVVVNEASTTSYGFKFAASDWSVEFAVAGSAPVILATEQGLAPAVGPGTESSIAIPEVGDYVFSFSVNDDGSANKMMVSKCAD